MGCGAAKEHSAGQSTPKDDAQRTDSDDCSCDSARIHNGGAAMPHKCAKHADIGARRPRKDRTISYVDSRPINEAEVGDEDAVRDVLYGENGHDSDGEECTESPLKVAMKKKMMVAKLRLTGAVDDSDPGAEEAAQLTAAAATNGAASLFGSAASTQSRVKDFIDDHIQQTLREAVLLAHLTKHGGGGVVGGRSGGGNIFVSANTSVTSLTSARGGLLSPNSSVTNDSFLENSSGGLKQQHPPDGAKPRSSSKKPSSHFYLPPMNLGVSVINMEALLVSLVALESEQDDHAPVEAPSALVPVDHRGSVTSIGAMSATEGKPEVDVAALPLGCFLAGSSTVTELKDYFKLTDGVVNTVPFQATMSPNDSSGSGEGLPLPLSPEQRSVHSAGGNPLDASHLQHGNRGGGNATIVAPQLVIDTTATPHQHDKDDVAAENGNESPRFASDKTDQGTGTNSAFRTPLASGMQSPFSPSFREPSPFHQSSNLLVTSPTRPHAHSIVAPMPTAGSDEAIPASTNYFESPVVMLPRYLAFAVQGSGSAARTLKVLVTDYEVVPVTHATPVDKSSRVVTIGIQPAPGEAPVSDVAAATAAATPPVSARDYVLADTPVPSTELLLRYQTYCKRAEAIINNQRMHLPSRSSSSAKQQPLESSPLGSFHRGIHDLRRQNRPAGSSAYGSCSSASGGRRGSAASSRSTDSAGSTGTALAGVMLPPSDPLEYLSIEWIFFGEPRWKRSEQVLEIVLRRLCTTAGLGLTEKYH